MECYATNNVQKRKTTRVARVSTERNARKVSVRPISENVGSVPRGTGSKKRMRPRSHTPTEGCTFVKSRHLKAGDSIIHLNFKVKGISDATFFFFSTTSIYIATMSCANANLSLSLSLSISLFLFLSFSRPLHYSCCCSVFLPNSTSLPISRK